MVVGNGVMEATSGLLGSGLSLSEAAHEFTHLKLMSLTQFIAVWFLLFGILSLIYGIYAVKRSRTIPFEADMAKAGIFWGIVMIAFGWFYW